MKIRKASLTVVTKVEISSFSAVDSASKIILNILTTILSPPVKILNTDASLYGGSEVGNAGGVHAEPVAAQERPCSLNITLPALATLIFELA